MDYYRWLSILVGSLTIAGMLFGILSVSPAIDDASFMTKISPARTRVLVAAFAQLCMAVVYVLIPVFLYPMVSGISGSGGVAYLSFRIVSAVFNLMGVFIILLLVWVSDAYCARGAADAGNLALAGDLLKAGRDFLNHVLMILTLSAGGLFFWAILLRSAALPSWLSLWGLAGTVLSAAASLLVMFRITGVITPLYLLLNVPLAVQEITFAFYLLGFGFNASALPKG